MNLIEIFTIIIGHYIADFLLQDVKWAENKSKSNVHLLAHTMMYSAFWLVLALIIDVYSMESTGNWCFHIYQVQYFVVITFICHTITDWITSRIVKKKFENKEYGTAIPNTGAFSVIGLDQVFHYIQLFLTYYLLIKV